MTRLTVSWPSKFIASLIRSVSFKSTMLNAVKMSSGQEKTVEKGKDQAKEGNIEKGNDQAKEGNVEKGKDQAKEGNVEKRKDQAKEGNVEKGKDQTKEGNVEKGKDQAKEGKRSVVYKLRDISPSMVEAWEDAFSEYSDSVQISQGDIFKKAPAADAIVSPANSFGFMDGGIDMVYSLHFGWQMQDRLREVIDKEKDGEILVGDAVIIPAYDDQGRSDTTDWSHFNEGELIKFLISAPTMRVPCNVSHTINAYLAFRAVILAVDRHNHDENKEPIRSVLCPGLGTAIGRMPQRRCAKQMLMAYETFVLGMHPQRRQPETLYNMCMDEKDMKEY